MIRPIESQDMETEELSGVVLQDYEQLVTTALTM